MSEEHSLKKHKKVKKSQKYTFFLYNKIFYKTMSLKNPKNLKKQKMLRKSPA